ncbi:MAG: M23 family metallopeptidase [Novosphingobium sp.]|nr:M23 family metallopeptidase [Novosphingobium sp.]
MPRWTRTLFKANEQSDYNDRFDESGPRSAAASLSHAQILPSDGAEAGAMSLRDRVFGWKGAIERKCEEVELAPDLAVDIGSAKWFRGLGTMLGLGIAAISFWPDFTAVEAATSMPVDAITRDEFRSQMIMPLALGSDSGRHMGATPLVSELAEAPERPTVHLTATLGQGDSFGRMLQRAGVGAGDAARVAELVSRQVPLSDIDSGTQFDITLGRRPGPGSPRPIDQLAFRARFDLDLAVERGEGGLAIRPKPIAVDTTPLRIRAPVGSGLYRSARAAGAPVEAIRQYLRAIDEHVSLESDVGSADEFDLIVEYKRSAKGETQLGKLLYAGLEHNGKPRLQLMRWGSEGQFYEASGVGQQRSRQFAPVSGRMTSRFGMRRHPILGYKRMHSGVDFGARHGSPIFAVSDGRVSYAGRHGGHGNYVRIEHGGGLGSGYAHMSRIAVSSGTTVRAGQVIGYVGSTGLSTGPHLHFEVYRGNRKIDPLSVKFTTRAQVDKNELASFKSRLAQLKAVEPGEALTSIAPKQAEVKAHVREIDKLEE